MGSIATAPDVHSRRPVAKIKPIEPKSGNFPPAKNMLELIPQKWRIRGWFFDNLAVFIDANSEPLGVSDRSLKPSAFGRGRHFQRRQTRKMRVRAARSEGWY
jgi:hypothetical protein